MYEFIVGQIKRKHTVDVKREQLIVSIIRKEVMERMPLVDIYIN